MCLSDVMVAASALLPLSTSMASLWGSRGLRALLLLQLLATCMAQDPAHRDPAIGTSQHASSLLPDGTVRLRDGYQAYQGRVEIYYDGNWGTICDAGWSASAAIVLCRQLGFGGVKADRVTFGQAAGPIFLQGLDCAGSEDVLTDCKRVDWLADGSCDHADDVGVVCLTGDEGATTAPEETVDGSLRLADGSELNNGRVEVYYQGQWGTVCQEKPDNVTAHVVCRQLGYTTANPEEAVPPGGYGPGAGPVWLSAVQCGGRESKLAFCAHDRWGENGCSHDTDLMVSCKTYIEPKDGDVRLTNGPNFQTGQVEIYYQGVWGTVCDDDWTIPDATVVCRQLDFRPARASYSFGYFQTDDPTIPVLFDSVECDGSEKRLDQCLHTWQSGVCDHTFDVGVMCGAPEEWKPVLHEDDGRVQLGGGTRSHNGRVEIKYQGKWGSVCDSGWGTPEAADVVCRQLGYPSAEGALPGAFFGQGSGKVILDQVSCEGTESGLAFCDHAVWNENDCDHSQDVSVVCTAPAPADGTADGTIRLAGDEAPLKGRLEVHYQGVWATVCGHGWGPSSSDVVCQQLGYPGANAQQPHFYEKTASVRPILLSTVACVGTEAALLDCPHLFAFVAEECSHDLDIGVACSPPTTTPVPVTTTTTTTTTTMAASSPTTESSSAATSPKVTTASSDGDGVTGDGISGDGSGSGQAGNEESDDEKLTTVAPKKPIGVLSTIWVIIILILMVPAILIIFILGLVIKRRLSGNSYKAVNQSSMPMSQRV